MMPMLRCANIVYDASMIKQSAGDGAKADSDFREGPESREWTGVTLTSEPGTCSARPLSPKTRNWKRFDRSRHSHSKVVRRGESSFS